VFILSLSSSTKAEYSETPLFMGLYYFYETGGVFTCAYYEEVL